MTPRPRSSSTSGRPRRWTSTRCGGDDSVDVNKGLAALIKVDVDLGDGNDSIRARNDSSQAINGGAGTDSARVDKTDTLTAVEKVSGLDRKAPKIKLAAKRLDCKNGTVAFKVAARRARPAARAP